MNNYLDWLKKEYGKLGSVVHFWLIQPLSLCSFTHVVSINQLNCNTIYKLWIHNFYCETKTKTKKSYYWYLLVYGLTLFICLIQIKLILKK